MKKSYQQVGHYVCSLEYSHKKCRIEQTTGINAIDLYNQLKTEYTI